MKKKETVSEKLRKLELENAELRGKVAGLQQVVEAVKSAPQPIVLAPAVSYPVPYVRPVYPTYVPWYQTQITTNTVPSEVTGLMYFDAASTITTTTWGN